MIGSLNKLPISWKLKLVILVTVVAALLVTATALFAFEKVAFNERLQHELSTLAQVIGDNCGLAVFYDQPDTAKKILSALEKEPQIIAASLYTKNGDYFEEYVPKGGRQEIPARPLQDGYYWRENRLEFFGPIIHQEAENDRVGTIYMAADFRGMQERLWRYAAVVAIVLLVSILIAYFLSSGLQRVISHPILDLAETAKLISDRKDYSARARKRSEDELGAFVDTFNQMIAQIQRQDGALRQSKEELELRVRQRTQELSALQQQKELILNSAGEGICGLDLEGKITFVNTAAARTIDWTVEELIGTEEHTALRHSDGTGMPYKKEECPICAGFRSGRSYTGNDEIFWRRNSTSFHAQYVRTPILAKGELAGAVVLFKDITEQKKAEQDLASLNKRLQDISRQAGMAEVATGVLHNVGNVLNSVNVSATLLGDHLRQFRPSSLAKLATVLKEHQEDLSRFLREDPQGRQVPDYLAALAGHLTESKSSMGKELDLLIKNIEHIKNIISMQQSYAKTSGVIESLPVASLVEDALQMNPGQFASFGIHVVREYEESPSISVDKQKALQILVNLIRNAREALKAADRPDKRLTVRITLQGEDRVRVEVQDNGVGISKENLTKIFAHGFTTKSDGHGFGLHSSAIAARDLGGSLLARSDGPGAGATFTVELPLRKPHA